MNASRSLLRRSATTALGILLLLGAGCENLFVPRHRLLVDAIAAPGATKSSGLSYRLVPKRSTVNNMPVHVPVVTACVDAALATVGMFPAAPNQPSDLFIEVSYGQDNMPRVDPAARETYVQLSARANPERLLDRNTGPELWDVKVAVLGMTNRIEQALPVLCSVAVNYIATDTHRETKVEIPQNAPAIASVRETAIKSLEGKSPVQGPPPAPVAPATPPPRPAR